MKTAAQMTEAYAEIGVNKSKLPILKMLLLGILAGILIGFGGATTNTATQGIVTPGVVRAVSGLLFAFGLGMVIVTGAELFTGNCLMIISVADKRITVAGMLRNLIVVYIGNFIGSLLLALVFAHFNCASSETLAVTTMKVAAGKCSIGFGSAFFQGIFCNLLVTIAVFMSLSSSEIPGRLMGAYIPVAVFVIIGFNHCVADMFYGPVGIIAKGVSSCMKAATDAGVNVDALTWGNYFTHNMIPVTLGNIVGGMGFGLLMWYSNLKGKKKA